jgi:pimeloyl-ACP methyl ester carboxylesterase
MAYAAQPLNITKGRPMTIWTELQGAGVAEVYYDANGIRTRALEAGQGGQRPLVLLHGTTGHAEAYYRNIVPLSRDRKVLAIDMIGHGYTDRPDREYTLDDYADHVLAVADALDAEQIDLSGNSLGAMTAAWFAIKHPDRVGRIIMATGLLAACPPDARGEIEEAIELTQAISDNLTKEAVRKRMEFLVYHTDDMTDELVDVRYKILEQPGMQASAGRTMATVLSWLAGHTGQEYMAPGVHGRIACPTMLLWSDHNPLWLISQAKAAAAELPDGQFVMIDNCGHWPQFEYPELVNSIHLDFFAQAAVTQGSSS